MKRILLMMMMINQVDLTNTRNPYAKAGLFNLDPHTHDLNP